MSNLVEDHKVSVVRGSDGKLQFLSKEIITPQGRSKTNNLVTVIPSPTETIDTLEGARHLFSQLKQINLILTNACNLSCTYCFEQHNRDFGRFTDESLMQVYRFLVNTNEQPNKVFQFFGGEPLIHKKLILDFLKNNKEELAANKFENGGITVSMVTNGLLLDEEFAKEYFSYDFTHILISLDTHIAEVDHREIGQENIDKLFEVIKGIPESVKSKRNLSIRCTLAMDNSEYVVAYVDKLYEAGIRRIVVHPLVHDFSNGYVSWDEDKWTSLHNNIVNLIDRYQDLIIHFSEGVGQKRHENCLTGSEMIAIDGSGDLSGCYFFTNHKGDIAGDTILANLLQDKVYTDRYEKFDKAYNTMFDTHEQCKSCDLKNACYQCPAGNVTIHNKLFQPDDMCQKIVRLYLDLQEDVLRKQFAKKYRTIMAAVESEGEESALSKAIAYMMHYYVFSVHPTPVTFNQPVNHKHLLSLWTKVMAKQITIDPRNFVQDLESKLDESEVELSDFYYKLTQKQQKKSHQDNVDSRVFYLTLLHLVVLKNKNKSF